MSLQADSIWGLFVVLRSLLVELLKDESEVVEVGSIFGWIEDLVDLKIGVLLVSVTLLD